MNQGMLFALICYGLWGVLPIFWKSIQNVPADQILAHRMIWSLAFVALFFLFKQGFGWMRDLLKNPRNLFYLFLASVLISINWFIYIWAVNSGHIVETSLGYFINPLMSFLLGVLVFKERPRILQWVSIFFAGSGVIYLTWSYGRVPWIALTLASSFAVYGVLKKFVKIPPMRGMFVETMILFIPAILFLVYQDAKGVGSFGHQSLETDLLLIFAGLFTLLPLYFFAGAAQKLPLSTLGIFQYLAPSMQFLIGIFIYQEIFTSKDLVGYSMIWFALILFSGESFGWVLRINIKKPFTSEGFFYNSILQWIIKEQWIQNKNTHPCYHSQFP